MIENNLFSLDVLVSNSIKNIELMSNSESLSGVPTGFFNLDYLTSGWQLSDLIVLAGSSSMGKTSFALSMINNMALNFNIGAAYFSLEMTRMQVTNRILALNLEIPYRKLINGNLEDYEFQFLHDKSDEISRMPLFIDDTPEISVSEICEKCKKLKNSHDIQLVVIDYLHLVSIKDLKAETREQELSLICRRLKTLAKELNIAIILISQLSRSLDSRIGNKRPQISDLKGSGAIEQIADVVSFIYRPEYYQILEDEEGNSLKGVGEIIVAKHRNGALDSARLKWDGQYAKFSNFGDDDDAFTGLDDSSFFEQANNELSGKTFFSKMNVDNDINIDDVPF